MSEFQSYSSNLVRTCLKKGGGGEAGEGRKEGKFKMDEGNEMVQQMKAFTSWWPEFIELIERRNQLLKVVWFPHMSCDTNSSLSLTQINE